MRARSSPGRMALPSRLTRSDAGTYGSKRSRTWPSGWAVAAARTSARTPSGHEASPRARASRNAPPVEPSNCAIVAARSLGRSRGQPLEARRGGGSRGLPPGVGGVLDLDLRGGALRDPIAHQAQAVLVEEIRADAGHPPRAELRHPVEQDGTVRVAVRDDPGVVDAERPLRGADVQGQGLFEGGIVPERDVGRASRPELMAMGAVDLEIGTRPFVEVRRRVVRVRQLLRGLSTVRSRALDPPLRRRQQAEGQEGLQLIRTGVVLAQLAGVEGEPVAGPGVVAGQAFGPAREMPRLFATPARGPGIVDDEGAIHPLGGHEVGVGLGVVPRVGIAPPVLAVEVEHLGFEAAAALGMAALHLEREGPRQDAVPGELERLDGGERRPDRLPGDDLDRRSRPGRRPGGRPPRGRPRARR